MKGYKAFEKGLICDPTGQNPFQYAENTVFETDTAEPCNSGFHFCKNPLDTLDYYPLIDDNGNMTEFAEVEALDDVKTDDNKKYCTKKLKIGAKLTLPQFIKASIDVTYENIKTEVEKETKKIKNSGDNATLAGANWAKLVGGDGAKLAGGYEAKLVGGDNATLAGGARATLAGGDNAKLAGGNGVTLVGGYYATLAGGISANLAGGAHATLAGGVGAKLAGRAEATLAGANWAKLVGGDGAKLAGGDNAELVGGDGAELAGGYEAKLVGGDNAKLAGGISANLVGGKNSLMIGDNGSIAKGKKGAVILLVERDTDYNILNFNAVQVDGEIIKEDTFYKLENGKFVEVK